MAWAAIGATLAAIGAPTGAGLAVWGATSHLWGDGFFLAGFGVACLLTVLGVYVLIAEFLGGIGPLRFPLPPTRHERETKRSGGPPRPPQSPVGPSPWARSPLERAVVDSLIAFEQVEREMAVQGEAGLFDRIMQCAGDVDLRLREADAGTLYEQFRKDGLHPPHGTSEQVAYLKRQIALFGDALRELRRDGG